MRPDLRVHADELAVERLGEELEIGVRAIGARAAAVMGRLLDLDERAAGSGSSRNSAFMMSLRSLMSARSSR
jgi:hypothetical protein